MLSRQRVLLYLLETAGGRVDHLHATKLAFSLKHDTASRGGDAFYDFLPYKFGPFSFALYQEAGKLGQAGLLTDEGKRWKISDEGKKQIGDLPSDVKRDADEVVTKLGRLSSDALLRTVYARHPWFTILSEVTRKERRPVAEPAVYTAGYEGLSVDAFLDRLLRRGIERVIDVRNNPVARRYGFHRRTLQSLCDKLGVEYRHFPELGIRSEDRQTLETSEDYDVLFKAYEHRIARYDSASVREVALLMREKPSVLLCMEADPARCHRTRLARAVESLISLPVSDLGVQ
ncbi:MAG: DUF488 domain-containing protein [Proteobacteria bacterium]|jgi:uncharacterized protein (DUF488 family)|nr:DUF488 domain-containing protein [Pseudomonadota bacterium]